MDSNLGSLSAVTGSGLRHPDTIGNEMSSVNFKTYLDMCRERHEVGLGRVLFRKKQVLEGHRNQKFVKFSENPF